MGSTFSGFNIAKSGLFTSQRSLNTTAHNIANANTPGFSRQRLETEASRPQSLPAANGMIGTGVDPLPVIQIRDEFLDLKFRDESSVLGEYGFTADMLENIETIFNEPSDSGVTAFLDLFFESLHELNKNPESLTTRSLVRQNAIALAENLSNMSTTLGNLQSDVDFQLSTIATDINGYARQIVDLNRIIYTSELDGSSANDIRDQRNLVVDKISELAEIKYFEDNLGRFHVTISGQPLVSHYNSDELVLNERTTLNNPDDVLKLNDVSWKSGATFSTDGGMIKSVLDMRDNISGSDKGIPYYVDKVNEFTDRLVSELNRVHMNGFTLDGESGIMLFTKNNMTSQEYEAEIIATGVDVTSSVLDGTSSFLSAEENNIIITENIKKILDNDPSFAGKSVKVVSDGTYYVTDRVTANELTVSWDIEEDLNNLAASETQTGIPGDGFNAIQLAEVRHNTYMFAWGSPDDFVKSLVSNLGVDTADAKRVRDNQEAIITQIDNSRQSVMGVSLDEEMSEMLKFQHAYNASARMMTTIDEMLDKIINSLGLVGR